MSRDLNRAASLSLIVCVLSACGAETAGGGPSGVIEGRVSLGPIMPVCQEGVPCDGIYANAKIIVRDKSGSTVATTNADQRGVFRVAVPAGAVVVGVDVEGTPPHCSQAEVVVAADVTVRANIDCDTGIR